MFAGHGGFRLHSTLRVVGWTRSEGSWAWTDQSGGPALRVPRRRRAWAWNACRTACSLALLAAAAVGLAAWAGPARAGIVYWSGAASHSGSDTYNYWDFGLPGASDWSSDSAGLTPVLQAPGASADVWFTATNALPAAGTHTLTTTLDQSYAINSLNMSVSAGTGIQTTVIDTNGNA